MQKQENNKGKGQVNIFFSLGVMTIKKKLFYLHDKRKDFFYLSEEGKQMRCTKEYHVSDGGLTN